MAHAADEHAAPHVAHRRYAPTRLRAAILTVSDSRTPDSDESGALIEELLRAAGHEVARRAIVPDEEAALGARLDAWIAEDGLDLVLINGGTGVAPRDRTIEVVRDRLEKELPGFGELFRALSFRDIGASAMASRALAGTARSRVVFCMPGSPAAVRLALAELILPEAAHLVGQLRRQP